MLTADQRKTLEAAFKQCQAELPPCPNPVKVQAGCKVSWRMFATEEEAKVASEHAKLEAEYYSYFGYDYGYFRGGEISKCGDGTWSVVFP